MSKVLVATQMDVLAVTMQDRPARGLVPDKEVEEKIRKYMGKKSEGGLNLYLKATDIIGKDAVICLTKVIDVHVDNDAVLLEKGITYDQVFDKDGSLLPGYIEEDNHIYKN